MSKLNRNTENQEHASHLPEHGPIDENGKEVLLSLKNVDITFGKGDNAVRAVKNATFDIHKGETFSLVGESGSGKTTIGRAVIRVNPLANGEILYKGVRISGKIPKTPVFSRRTPRARAVMNRCSPTFKHSKAAARSCISGKRATNSSTRPSPRPAGISFPASPTTTSPRTRPGSTRKPLS